MLRHGLHGSPCLDVVRHQLPNLGRQTGLFNQPLQEQLALLFCRLERQRVGLRQRLIEDFAAQPNDIGFRRERGTHAKDF